MLELSRAVLSATDGWIAVLKVYLDESGTHEGSPVITVGAYIARPKQWEAFTKAWRRAIRPIEVYHAADAANCHGEFEGWTSGAVAKLAARALPLIPKHTNFAMAAGINLRDYEAALKGKAHLRRFLGEPYGACLQWTLSAILRTKAVEGNREQIAFFHEENDYAAEAIQAFQYVTETWSGSDRVSFAFGSKKKYVPLQAADIYAYETNKRLRNPTTPNRRALEALVPDKRRASLWFFNQANMGALIHRLEMYARRESNARLSSAVVR